MLLYRYTIYTLTKFTAHRSVVVNKLPIIVFSNSSLKTADNLEVVAKIPNGRMILETDCPWCEVRPTHAGAKLIKTTFPTVKKEKWQAGSMVKGRNEPANIV
jgi:TatD DNase family protein